MPVGGLDRRQSLPGKSGEALTLNRAAMPGGAPAKTAPDVAASFLQGEIIRKRPRTTCSGIGYTVRMSEQLELQQKIQDTHATIAQLEEALAADPGSLILRLNRESVINRLSRLNARQDLADESGILPE